MITMFTLLILLPLIQVSIGPEISPDGTIQRVSIAELQELLKKPRNVKEVQEIMNLIQNNKHEEAQKRIKKLKKKKMSDEMLWVLKQLLITPQRTFVLFLRPALLALHEKLQNESTTYKSFAGPVGNFIEGAGYIILKFLGFAALSTGELTQLINDLVKQGNAAWNSEVRNEKMHNTIDEAAEKVKKFGSILDRDSAAGLQGITWRRKQQQKASELQKNDAASSNQSGGK